MDFQEIEAYIRSSMLLIEVCIKNRLFMSDPRDESLCKILEESEDNLTTALELLEERRLKNITDIKK